MKFALTLTLAALMLSPAGAQSRQPKDIVDTAVAAGQFKTLAAALTAADLVGALKGSGPLTVFAPTDKAFAKLPKETLQSLLKPENKDQLVAILTYHVVSGKFLAGAALAAGDANTLQGDSVNISLIKGRLLVNEARVEANDIECSNGVIHVIDSVLLPPKPAKGLIGIYPGNPSNKQRQLLGLGANEGTRVTGVTDGGGAAKAGILEGDVIVAINGQRANHGLLDEAKAEAGVGGTIELVIARTVKVKVQAEK